MKKIFVLTAVFTKFTMFLCISLMGMGQQSVAAKLSPCHQKTVKEEATEPCEMCETALEAWKKNAVIISGLKFRNAPDFAFSADSITREFVFELKPLEGVYQAYYPPPQVLLKAVTPNTKTIVLLS